jgi:polar amino acid transport system substrate-binding protein
MAERSDAPQMLPRFFLLIAFAIISCAVDRAAAQTAPVPTPAASLRVATRVVPPFVMRIEGKLQGFSIDLWSAIAREMGANYELKELRSLADLLGAVKTGQVDLAVAATSITAKREREFDFSQPMFESGLQIMVPAGNQGVAVPSFLGFFASRAFLEFLGLLLLLVLIPAHVVWLVERKRDEGIASRSYFPGIFEAAWWAAGTLGGQADAMPRSPLGRVIALIWMFISVLFIASFTAIVTTSMTIQGLKNDINGPRDLAGRRVAAIADSTSAHYLAGQSIDFVPFEHLEEAYQAVETRHVDALVHDAPILLYYASHDGRGKVQVVGSVFREENYGILFPFGSLHRKPVNAALLRLKETGEFSAIYKKWFGAEALQAADSN